MPERSDNDRELVIDIDAQGRLQFVYDDALAPVLALGEADVRRVSVVSWTVGGWVSDLSPVSGPTQGPLASYAEAVAAEVAWLQKSGPTPPGFAVRIGFVGLNCVN